MNDKEIHIALGKLFSGLDLKAEKVELGLVEDVDKLFNETKQVSKEFKATRKKLSDIAADKNKAASKARQKAEKLMQKYERAAKDLGLNVSKQEPYQDLEFIIKRLGEVQNAYGRMSSKIFQEKI